MKTKFTFFIGSLFCGLVAQAQSYCTFTSPPYASSQPGITNFKMANINRTSANIEGANAFVMTGQTITLTIGQTYSFSITSSNDLASGAPLTGAPQHLRIYIDFNANTSFTETGETAYSFDYITFTPTNAASATYTATGVTIPATVTPGNSRLRVTAKMGPDAGHTPPSPCNIPADPLEYHGEMEEYNVVFVSGGVGVGENTTTKINAGIFPNPLTETSTLSYNLTQNAKTTVCIYNLLGEKIAVLLDEEQQAGAHNLILNKNELIKRNTGIYLVELTSGTAVYRQKVVAAD
jgi:hypothetical protein